MSDIWNRDNDDRNVKAGDIWVKVRFYGMGYNSYTYFVVDRVTPTMAILRHKDVENDARIKIKLKDFSEVGERSRFSHGMYCPLTEARKEEIRVEAEQLEIQNGLQSILDKIKVKSLSSQQQKDLKILLDGFLTVKE